MGGTIVVVGSSNIDLDHEDGAPAEAWARPSRTARSRRSSAARARTRRWARRARAAASSFVGCVGDDAYGAQVVENLGARRDRHALRVRGAGRRLGHRADHDRRRRRQLHLGRARRELPAHARARRRARATRSPRAACVVTQCEILPETLDHVVELAASLGKPVILNLAPARAVADATLARLACLAVNETRGRVPDRPAGGDRRRRRGRGRGAAARRGPKTVAAHPRRARRVRRRARASARSCPAFAVDAVDTTAAGDVHCGAFAVATVEGRPLLEAVRFANAAAALSVDAPRARSRPRPSQPRRDRRPGLRDGPGRRCQRCGRLMRRRVAPLAPAAHYRRAAHGSDASEGRAAGRMGGERGRGRGGGGAGRAGRELPKAGGSRSPSTGTPGATRRARPTGAARRLPPTAALRPRRRARGESRAHIVGLADLSVTGRTCACAWRSRSCDVHVSSRIRPSGPNCACAACARRASCRTSRTSTPGGRRPLLDLDELRPRPAAGLRRRGAL